MICDHCKTIIARGDSYSLTEYGRLHARCLRATTSPDRPGPPGPDLDAAGDPARLERAEPIYALRRL